MTLFSINLSCLYCDSNTLIYLVQLQTKGLFSVTSAQSLICLSIRRDKNESALTIHIVCTTHFTAIKMTGPSAESVNKAVKSCHVHTFYHFNLIRKCIDSVH